MGWPFRKTPVPLTTFNADTAAYERTRAPPPVWVGGRGGYVVARALATNAAGYFAVTPVPIVNDIDAGGFGFNSTPGYRALQKRPGAKVRG